MTVTPVIDDDVVDNLLTVGPELVDDSVLVGGALFGDFVKIHDLLQQEIHPPRVVVLIKLSGAVEGGHSSAPTTSSTCQGKDFTGTSKNILVEDCEYNNKKVVRSPFIKSCSKSCV